MDGDQMAGVVMTVHADRGKIVAIRMENGYSLLPDRRNEELYACRCRNGQDCKFRNSWMDFTRRYPG